MNLTDPPNAQEPNSSHPPPTGVDPERQVEHPVIHAQEPAAATRPTGQVVRLKPKRQRGSNGPFLKSRLIETASELPAPAVGHRGKRTVDFTDGWCKAQPPAPAGKRDVTWDAKADTAELSFRVTDHGAKSWVVEKWFMGRSW